MGHPDADRLRGLFDALHDGRLEHARALLAPDVLWHVPGDGPLAGDHRGADAALHVFARLYDFADGTYRPTVEAALADGRHAAAIVVVRATIAGTAVEDRGVHVARMDGGVVAEAWSYAWDQPAIDRLMDAVLAARA